HEVGVGLDVDETRRHREPAGVDGFLGPALERGADCDDAAARDGEIGPYARSAAAVDQRAAAYEKAEIGHRGSGIAQHTRRHPEEVARACARLSRRMEADSVRVAILRDDCLLINGGHGRSQALAALAHPTIPFPAPAR